MNVVEVYEGFAALVGRLVPCDWITINKVDLQRGTVTLAYIAGAEIPGREAGTVVPLAGTFTEAVVQSPQGLVLDVDDSGECARKYPGLVPYLEAGVRSFLGVPVVSRGEVIATLNMVPAAPTAYTGHHMKLAQNIGAQIAGAIANAETYAQREKAERAARRLAAENHLLADVGRIITLSPNIDDVYHRFADRVREHMGFDYISISLVGVEEGVSISAYASGVDVPGRRSGDRIPLPGSLTESVMRTRAAKLIETDSREELETTFPGLLVPFDSGLRSFLSVPLFTGDEVIAVLNVRSVQQNVYSGLELGLMEQVGRQIAPAIENARLFEQVKSNAEEIAAVDEVARLITTSLDLNQVYEQFATEAKKHVDFDRIYINRLDLDSGTLELKYISGVPVEGLEPGRIGPIEGTQSEEVVRSGGSLVRHDISEEKRFTDDPTNLAMGLRSSIAVPLISKGEVIGILGLRSSGVGTYGSRERIILERLASQIAPAVENADLFQKVDQLALAIANIGEGVCVTDPEGRILFVNQALEHILGYQPGDLVGEDVARLYPGGAEDPGLENITAGLTAGGWSGEVELLSKNGEWIPSLETAAAIYDPGSRLVDFVYTNIDIRERKLAEEELRHRNLELQTLSRWLVEVQEGERRHVARELHDEIGQVLTGLKLSLELIPRAPEDAVKANLDESKVLVNELMGKVIELSLDLRPAMLDDLGLLPTLLWYFERFTARTQVDVGFEHTGLDRRFLPEVETTAYRIVQEALTNVARHAGADGVLVRLWSNDEVLGLSVKDHGAGFDAADESILNQSNGLAGMRERAALLGGQLTLESAPGLGTNLFAELPVGDRDDSSRDRNGHDNHSPGG